VPESKRRPKAEQSSKRRAQAESAAARKAKALGPNPPWFLPVMVGLMVIGLVWIVVFYITQGSFPIGSLNNWNLLIGFALLMAGFFMTTRWR
jgi:hydrogenase-4 membrane subunit HyfE